MRLDRLVLRAFGAFLVLVCGALAALAFVSGIAVFGKHDVQYGCLVEAPTPTVGGPYFEDTRLVSAERTFFPLGAVCVLDSPDDHVGPQTVRIQSWPQTIIWLVMSAGTIASLVLVIRPPRAGSTPRP